MNFLCDFAQRVKKNKNGAISACSKTGFYAFAPCGRAGPEKKHGIYKINGEETANKAPLYPAAPSLISPASVLEAGEGAGRPALRIYV